MNKPPDETLKQGRNRSWLLVKFVKTDKVKNYEHKLIIHYTHGKRFHSFKHDMHKLYEDHFGNPAAMNIKMIVGNCNRRSARHELIRKRPNKALLQNRPIKSKYFDLHDNSDTSLENFHKSGE